MIREEIREAIDNYTDDGCLYPDRSCNALASGYCASNKEAYNCLLEKLTELGVVIKAEGESEVVTVHCVQDVDSEQWWGYVSPVDIVEAGYTKTIPLIEEEQDFATTEPSNELKIYLEED